MLSKCADMNILPVTFEAAVCCCFDCSMEVLEQNTIDCSITFSSVWQKQAMQEIGILIRMMIGSHVSWRLEL